MAQAHDAEIIEAVNRGERERFAELIDRHQRMVYAISWSYLGDADTSEDAAQETFVKAFRYLRGLRNPERFGGWVARIARNVSATLLRKRRTELASRRRWQLTQPVASGPATGADEKEEMHLAVEAAMAELKPKYRECLVLFYLEEKSIREAAGALGIAESAMKARLHRARRALRGKLEERIAGDLGRLGPRKNFGASVMLLLPEMPLGFAGIGGAGVLGKTLGWFGKLLPGLGLMLWMTVGQFAVFYLLMRWFAGLESSNLVKRPENEFRKKILRRNVLTIVIVAVAVMAASRYAAWNLGMGTVFQALSLYCAWGLWCALRLLRINSSAFVKGQVLTMATFTLVAVLIGFFGAPYPIFIVGMVMINGVLLWTNREMPRRHDYNLFLRQVQGILGDGAAAAAPPVDRLTDPELRAFARFLGGQWLAADYSRKADALVLRLPPVRVTARNSLLASMAGQSSVVVERSGVCRARLRRSDVRALESLSGRPVDVQALETTVAGVVRGALGDFLRGDETAARSRLTKTGDEEVFVTTRFGKTRAHRIVGGISMAAALLMLVSFGFLPGAWSWGSAWHNWRPRTVTVAMAREAVGQWLQIDPHYITADWHQVWNHPAHPSMQLLGEGNAGTYRGFVRERLKGNQSESVDGAVDARIFNALLNPYVLYHAVTTPILSADELAGIGFSPQRMREAIDGLDPEMRDRLIALDEQTISLAAGDTFRTEDIESYALRLRLFDAFGCLNLVDREAMAALIAGRQVGPGFTLPEGFQPIDREQADGLIDMGMVALRMNHAALMALETLGGLDRIDKEACIRGILRFHQGGGEFKHKLRGYQSGIWISGNDQDNAYFALESLALLGGLDRVADDLDDWSYRAETQLTTVDGKPGSSGVTGDTVRILAMRERLEMFQRRIAAR